MSVTKRIVYGMNFITQCFKSKKYHIQTSVSVPPPPIKNFECTLTARWTFNYIILSIVKAHFCTSSSILHLYVNGKILQKLRPIFISRGKCVTESILCCIFTWKNYNKNCFILLHLKMETEPNFEMWFLRC